MQAVFYVVLYNSEGAKVHESLPHATYPTDETIDFGLDYKDVAYAQVEKRYIKS